MGGPASVCDTAMGIENLGFVDTRGLDELLELSDLADLLESKNLLFLVTVYGETGGVVAAIFEAGET